jgi:GNAT superfamily N-acetyltransferase
MPIFSSLTLAARLERAECSLLGEGAAGALRRKSPPDVFVRPLAGGLAVWAGEGSPLNKVAGLGFAGPLDQAELEAVEKELEARRSPIRVELAHCAEPSIGALLTARGYRLVGYENVLARPLDATTELPIAPGVEVRPATAEEEELWLDCVVDGFASPDEQGIPSDESFPRDLIAEVMRDLTSGAGFRRYLARVDGDPAGGASLRLDRPERLAQLAGAATLPRHRRRGVQSSLLAARLAEARAEGSDLAVVTTQPGSKSQQNVQRQGFELLYARAVLVRERSPDSRP